MPAVRPSTRRNKATTLGKLSTPRIVRAFARERLFKDLDKLDVHPVTWVAAAPGSGKTTLVSSWLAARKRFALWVQLDRGDSDPATFFHYASLSIGAAGGRVKKTPLSFTDDDRRDLPGFARRYFRRALEVLNRPWILVLDNYQELADDSALHASLAEALEELPGSSRWIVISRAPPPAAYSRALSTRAIGTIESAALRFSLDETRKLVASHCKDRIAPSIHTATGGWAAGIVLMLATNDAFASPVDADTSHEKIFDYFAAEVLAKMSPAEQRVLTRVAFLPSATSAMAVAISGDPDAGKMLAELARRSLFTDRRGKSEPVFVFHALFSAFLQARAAISLTVDEITQLRQRAGAILERHGRIEAAIAMFIASAAWSEATRLIDAFAPTYLDQGRNTPVREWIEALPASFCDRPRMLYLLGCCDIGIVPATATERFTAAFEAFERAGDPHGALLAAAGAAESITYEASEQSALERWIEAFTRLAPIYFETRDAQTELKVLPAMLAAFVYRQPSHRLTLVLVERAERLLTDSRFASNHLFIASLAYVLTQLGEVERAARVQRIVDQLRITGDTAPVTALRWYSVAIFFKAVAGEAAAACTDAEHALSFLEKHPNPVLRMRILVRAAQAAWAARDAPLARRYLDEARRLIKPGNWIDEGICEHISANLALFLGDTASAMRHYERSIETTRRAGRPLGESIMEIHSALGATEHGDYEKAERALARAKSNQQTAALRLHRYTVAMIEAYLADRLDQPERCIEALTRGLRDAKETGLEYEALLFVHDSLMPRLCALALEHGIEVAFVRRLIRNRGVRPPSLDVVAWPWPIRLTTLGRFAIERDGEPLPMGRKESRRAFDLVKLAATSAEGISVSRIIQSLWPDADGDAAKLSFDSTMHRLRKILGLEAAVELRNGVVSLNPSLVWTDVAALEHAFTQADDALRAANDSNDTSTSNRVDAATERILELYQGAFAPGSDDLPPAIAARDRLRGRFLRTVSRIGEHLEQAGRHEAAVRAYQRAIEHDVLAEEVYRRLMECHLRLGKNAEAFETYRRCRDNLSIILGIKPSRETEAVAARLRDG